MYPSDHTHLPVRLLLTIPYAPLSLVIYHCRVSEHFFHRLYNACSLVFFSFSENCLPVNYPVNVPFPVHV